MNNFEKIKQMSVDEMAEFMDYINTFSACNRYCVFKNDKSCIGKDDCCLNYIKNWLLQEVEE